MKNRDGFTLIEMLVVIALVAVIAPMAGSMIYLLIRAQAGSAAALADGVLLSRFDDRFCDDVHQTRRAETSGDGPTATRLVLSLDPRQVIEYAVEPTGTISRVVKTGAKIDRREQFRLAAIVSRFEVAADGREVAVIHGSRPIAGTSQSASKPAPSGQPAAFIRVSAVVARDHRFEADRPKPAAGPPQAPASGDRSPQQGAKRP